MKFLNRIVVAFAVVAMLATTTPVLARGSFGGGSRSFSSSRSFSGGSSKSFSSGGSKAFSSGSSSTKSFSSPKHSSTSSSTKSFSSPKHSSTSSSTKSFSSSTKSSESGKSVFGGKRTVTTPKTYTTKYSTTDKALINKAKANHTMYNSRSEATKAFQNNKAMQTKYTSSFKTEPTTRPDYIPKTYSNGGQTYNVTYNSQYGGYGYMCDGRWMMYNALADAAMLSVLMSHNNYVYGERVAHGGGTTVVHDRMSPFGLFIIVVLVIVALFVIFALFGAVG